MASRFRRNMAGQQHLALFEEDEDRRSSLKDVIKHLKGMEDQFSHNDIRSFVNSAICNHCDETRAIMDAKFEYQQDLGTVETMIEDGQMRELRSLLKDRGFTEEAADRHIARFTNPEQSAQQLSEYWEQESTSVTELREGIEYAANVGLDVDHRTMGEISRITDQSATAESDGLEQYMKDYAQHHHQKVFDGLVPMTSAPRVDFARVMSPEGPSESERTREASVAEMEHDELSGASLKRGEVGVVRASDTVRAFMAVHGRNPDGTKMGTASGSEQDYQR